MSPGFYAFVMLILLVLLYYSVQERCRKLEKRIEALEKRSETEKDPQ